MARGWVEGTAGRQQRGLVNSRLLLHTADQRAWHRDLIYGRYTQWLVNGQRRCIAAIRTRTHTRTHACSGVYEARFISRQCCRKQRGASRSHPHQRDARPPASGTPRRDDCRINLANFRINIRPDDDVRREERWGTTNRTLS